jgi:capsular polysaccharide biosynthesis protein
MSEQPLDLRRSVRIVRRHRVVFAVAAVLGLLAGATFIFLNPPLPASEALVVLPASAARISSTEVVIAGSDPVLLGAMRELKPPVPLRTLEGRVHVRNVTPGVLSISAEGMSARQAEDAANAVARSYVAYVNTASSPGGRVESRLLEPAVNATQRPLSIDLLIAGGPGLLLGSLIGAVTALAVDRSDRRLRGRDEIADAIGVPVLASLQVWHPADAADWSKLLDDYQPSPVDAWRLRKALQDLGTESGLSDGNVSLAVLSFSGDRKTLAIGPHLAAFAASLGIRTTLVVGPQPDPAPTATLRAACAGSPPPARRTGNLRVAVTETVTELPAADPSSSGLTVVVAVLDAKNPELPDLMRTTITLLGVSAGAATADQLARAAASAAAGGRHIAGILVADPDPADRTTGRVPQVSRSAQWRTPTRAPSTLGGSRQ